MFFTPERPQGAHRRHSEPYESIAWGCAGPFSRAGRRSRRDMAEQKAESSSGPRRGLEAGNSPCRST